MFCSQPLSVGSLASSNTSLQSVTTSLDSGVICISWSPLMLHIDCCAVFVTIHIHSAALTTKTETRANGTSVIPTGRVR